MLARKPGRCRRASLPLERQALSAQTVLAVVPVENGLERCAVMGGGAAHGELANDAVGASACVAFL